MVAQKMQERFYDWGIVGDGIAARYCCFQLQKKFKDESLLKISSNKLCPSISSTGLKFSAINGIKTNVSPLGDKLIEGFHLLEKFYQEEQPEGIYKGTNYFLILDTDKEREKVARRFTDFQILTK